LEIFKKTEDAVREKGESNMGADTRLAQYRGIWKAILVVLAMITMVCSLTGCFGKQYRVDYCGQKELYEGAKDSYGAGQEVTLYFPLVATDTDYRFYLDGESIDFDYDQSKGFIIRFVMPEHDVVLECESENSMIYEPEMESGKLMFDYYYADETMLENDGYYEITLTTGNDTLWIYLDEYIKESKETEERGKCYFVPYEVLDECMAIVDQYNMYSWNEREDAVSLDGALTVCKFHDGEKIIRISTESMPEDGEKALGQIREILNRYMEDEDLIYDTHAN